MHNSTLGADGSKDESLAKGLSGMKGISSDGLWSQQARLTSTGEKHIVYA